MLKLCSLIGLHNPKGLENTALESDVGKAFHANYTSAREPYGYAHDITKSRILAQR